MSFLTLFKNPELIDLIYPLKYERQLVGILKHQFNKILEKFITFQLIIPKSFWLAVRIMNHSNKVYSCCEQENGS